MRTSYIFLIESERSRNKLFLNGKEIATFATLDAAKAEAAKANERTTTLEAEAARSNERAAKLEKEASEARLEQERLKARLAWRVLPPAASR